MITVTKYNKANDYTELAITGLTTDETSMPTMTKGCGVIPRCRKGSLAVDDNGNTYRLMNNNTWQLFSTGSGTGGSTEDTTTAFLTNYTKSFTTDQKTAVKTFITGLKSNGIWEKIGNLYMPVLAGDLSEAIFNVKTETVDATPSSNAYGLANNGLKAISNVNEKIYVSYTGSQQDFHCLFYNTTEITDSSSSDLLLGSEANGFISYTRFPGAFSGKTDGNTDITYPSKLLSKATPSLFGSVQTSTGNMVVGSSDQSIGGTAISTNNPYTNASFILLAISSAIRESKASYGLISLGAALTAEQAAAYSSLADALMTAMGVTVA